MKNKAANDELTSGFAVAHGQLSDEVGGGIDFSLAKRLERHGSTCQSWEAVVQRRRVFVKQLKPEFRGDPLYRAAFDKEFDLGVRLSHPSLPHYISIHDDYIVMNFIEGDTLADLLARKDSRLANRDFFRRILSELVNVIDYLHNNGVVHCDIKSDNIIVSPLQGKPVTLIDLDKAYTSWLDSTCGNPEKYGCNSVADGMIDFRGLANIAEKLGCERFARACRRDDVTAETLRRLLATHRRKWITIAIVGLLLFAAGIGAYIFWKKSPEVSADATAETPDKISSAPFETDAEVLDGEPSENPSESPSDSPRVEMFETPAETMLPTPAIPAPERNDIAENKLHENDLLLLNELIASKIAGLPETRARLIYMINNGTLPPAAAAEYIESYLETSANAQNGILNDALDHFPDHSRSEIQNALRQNQMLKQLISDDAALKTFIE